MTLMPTALLLAGYLALSPRLKGSSNWKAMVTPLASIMGSGFLVSAPLLGGLVGNLALVASYTVKHNTDVPPLTEKTDTYTALSLEYGF